MNGRIAKKIRRETRTAALKRDEKILPDLKKFINQQPFGDRVRIAARILLGRF